MHFLEIICEDIVFKFCRYTLEMQSSGPAVRSGPKFRPGRAFCEARTTNAGLMPGSGEAITMYYSLAAGHRAVLDRCWPGSMLGSADFERCRSGLGLGFRINFCTSNVKLVETCKMSKVRYHICICKAGNVRQKILHKMHFLWRLVPPYPTSVFYGSLLYRNLARMFEWENVGPGDR